MLPNWITYFARLDVVSFQTGLRFSAGGFKIQFSFLNFYRDILNNIYRGFIEYKPTCTEKGKKKKSYFRQYLQKNKL